MGDTDSPSEKLPIELIHHIIADIDTDQGLSALRACSLVCLAWADICRSCIFRSVVVHSPHLCKYVLELTIHEDYGTRTSWMPPEWTPELFGWLKNLRSLAFFCVTGEVSALPAPMANGLPTLLQAPRLRKLHIQHWNFENDVQALHHMLSLCSASLEHLALVGVSSNSTVHELATVRLAALSTLRLHYVNHPGLTEAFLQCPNLRSMEMGIEDGRLFFPSDVENLNLTVERLGSVPELQRTTRLSALTISALTCPTTISDFHVWLKGCTHRLLRPDLLSQLTLELQHDRTTTEYPELAEYKAFSAYLAQFRDRSGLKQISIDITLFTWEESPAPYIIHHAREVAKLKDGFAPVLGLGVDIRLHVRSLSSVLMECRA
ncbi:hypothetical protein EYR40_006199 [Pleurotus pulmonarius]|nr:hypothetical protein EYR40_006199 [Pleurotus pulmonarius]